MIKWRCEVRGSFVKDWIENFSRCLISLITLCILPCGQEGFRYCVQLKGKLFCLLFRRIWCWTFRFIAHRSKGDYRQFCPVWSRFRLQRCPKLCLCFLTYLRKFFLRKQSFRVLFLISFSSVDRFHFIRQCICLPQGQNGLKILWQEFHCRILVALRMSPFIEGIGLLRFESMCRYCFSWWPKFMICRWQTPQTCTDFSTQTLSVGGFLPKFFLCFTSNMKGHLFFWVRVFFWWTNFHTCPELAIFLRFFNLFWCLIGSTLSKYRVCILSRFCFIAWEFHGLCKVLSNRWTLWLVSRPKRYPH